MLHLQSELGRVKTQLFAKEEELKRTKQQAENDKRVAHEESRSSQSEIGKLKKEVQSLTETQRQLETKNKVRIKHSMIGIQSESPAGTSRSSKTP